jgi:hypothetical protein
MPNSDLPHDFRTKSKFDTPQVIGILTLKRRVDDYVRWSNGWQRYQQYECECSLCNKVTVKRVSQIKPDLKRCSRECQSKAGAIKAGDRFGDWLVLEEHKPKIGVKVKCKCGTTAYHKPSVLLHGLTKKCRACMGRSYSKNKSELDYSGVTSAGSRREGHIRPYDIWCGMRRRGVICAEWEDNFPAFLEYYLKAGGMQLSDFTGPNVPWSYHKVSRPDETKPYGPGNLLVVAFRTERAWHTPTYQYWMKLSRQGILDDAMATSYVLFLNTFGIKERGHLLRRKDITQPHSKQNSEWIRSKRSVTT